MSHACHILPCLHNAIACAVGSIDESRDGKYPLLRLLDPRREHLMLRVDQQQRIIHCPIGIDPSPSEALAF